MTRTGCAHGGSDGDVEHAAKRHRPRTLATKAAGMSWLDLASQKLRNKPGLWEVEATRITAEQEKYIEAAAAVIAGDHGEMKINVQLVAGKSWKDVAEEHDVNRNSHGRLKLAVERTIDEVVKGYVSNLAVTVAAASGAVAELEVAREQCEKLKAKLADQQKLAQRYKVRWWRAQKESARETKDARETEVELRSAVSILKRRLAEHRADIDALYEQSEESDHIIKELKGKLTTDSEAKEVFQTYENGKYTPRMLLAVLVLLNANTPTKKINPCLHDLATLFGVKFESSDKRRVIPSDKLARQLNVTALLISETQTVERLAAVPDGTATQCSDEGSVKGKKSFATAVQIPSADGVGAKPEFVATGLTRIARATSQHEVDAIERVHQNHVVSYQHFAKCLAEVTGSETAAFDVSLDSLFRKYGNNESDQANGQLLTNEKFLDKVMAAVQRTGSYTDEQLATMRSKMLSWPCMLHMPMNCAKELVKAVSQTAVQQQSVIDSVLADHEFDEGEVDNSLEDQHRPTVSDQQRGKAHMAGYTVDKLLNPLHDQEQTRRGDVYDLMLRAAGIPGLGLRKLKGSRENAMLTNMAMAAKGFTDETVGCYNCPTCRAKIAELDNLFPPIEEGSPEKKLCLVCFVKTKMSKQLNASSELVVKCAPLNRHDQAVVRFYSMPCICEEWIYFGFFGDQFVDVVIRQTPNLVGSDLPKYLRKCRDGLLACRADPEPYLRGTKRILNDFCEPEINLLCSNDTTRKQITERFFMAELQLLSEKIFQLAYQYEKKNVMATIAIAIEEYFGVETLGCDFLYDDPSLGGLQDFADVWSLAVSVFLSSNDENSVETWRQIIGNMDEYSVALHSMGDNSFAFDVELKLHVRTNTTDCLEFLIGDAIDNIKALTALGVDGCLSVMKRQAGKFMDWVMTAAERRQYCYVLTRNDPVETMMAHNDRNLRRANKQRSVVTSSRTICATNDTIGRLLSEWATNRAQAEVRVTACHSLSLKRGREEAIYMEALHKEQIEEHEAAMVLHKERDDRQNATKKRAYEHNLVTNIAQLPPITGDDGGYSFFERELDMWKARRYSARNWNGFKPNFKKHASCKTAKQAERNSKKVEAATLCREQLVAIIGWYNSPHFRV
eukprot:SAG31_NODE_3099_length_4677_cov_15.742246_1_plen_1126_part_00